MNTLLYLLVILSNQAHFFATQGRQTPRNNVWTHLKCIRSFGLSLYTGLVLNRFIFGCRDRGRRIKNVLFICSVQCRRMTASIFIAKVLWGRANTWRKRGPIGIYFYAMSCFFLSQFILTYRAKIKVDMYFVLFLYGIIKQKSKLF